jgi:hypothetical protein
MYMSNVDEANVGTSNFVESSNRWIRALEASTCEQLQMMTKEFEIVEIGVEEGFVLGSRIKFSSFPNVVS